MTDVEEFDKAIEPIGPIQENNESIELPDVVKGSILEAIECNNTEATITRIDQYLGFRPPHGIDANDEVAEMLGEMTSRVDSRYLEAPNDMEQVKECAERIKQIEGSSYEDWGRMNINERARVLANIENEVAKIAHRNPCNIMFQKMPFNHHGFYDPNTKTITLNSEHLNDSSQYGYTQCMETLLHEGRHAYQDYNLTIRQVHSNELDINAWRANDYGYGYLDVATYGYEAYSKQPVEVDARDFASSVMDEMRGEGQTKGNIHESTQADVDYYAHMVRITSGVEQKHWLDRYNWALKHLK